MNHAEKAKKLQGERLERERLEEERQAREKQEADEKRRTMAEVAKGKVQELVRLFTQFDKFKVHKGHVTLEAGANYPVGADPSAFLKAGSVGMSAAHECPSGTVLLSATLQPRNRDLPSEPLRTPPQRSRFVLRRRKVQERRRTHGRGIRGSLETVRHEGTGHERCRQEPPPARPLRRGRLAGRRRYGGAARTVQAAQQAAIRRGTVDPLPPVPPPPVIYVQSQVAAVFHQAHQGQAILRSGSTLHAQVPQDEFPVLVSRAVITPYEKNSEGELIRAVTVPLLAIIKKIMEDPTRLYGIDPRKLEEIIAAAYAQSGLFDEVTLTPRSGDRGKDLIAVKKGFGSVRIVESVKRYTPGHLVTAEEVDALIGVMNKQPQTSKGVISTTWEFAPKIMDDPDIARLVPTRLELVNGTALVERFRAYTKLKT